MILSILYMLFYAAAGILMRAAGASNVTAHVYGWGAYNSSTGGAQHNGKGRGMLATGGASVGPAGGAQGPAKGLHLHGGTFRANNIDNANWGVGVKDEKKFDVLSVGPGYNYLTLVNGAGNGGGKPINAVTARTLAQTDKGTLVVYDPSLNSRASQNVTNAMFTVENWAGRATANWMRRGRPTTSRSSPGWSRTATTASPISSSLRSTRTDASSVPSGRRRTSARFPARTPTPSARTITAPLPEATRRRSP